MSSTKSISPEKEKRHKFVVEIDLNNRDDCLEVITALENLGRTLGTNVWAIHLANIIREG